jgi:hypothetical protein
MYPKFILKLTITMKISITCAVANKVRIIEEDVAMQDGLLCVLETQTNVNIICSPLVVF